MLDLVSNLIETASADDLASKDEPPKLGLFQGGIISTAAKNRRAKHQTILSVPRYNATNLNADLASQASA